MHSLSTGMPHPTQPRELVSIDAIGPFAMPVLNGECYILHASCAISSYIALRTCKNQDEFPMLIEEMVVEMKTKLQLLAGQQLKVTVHSDNDKVMICKATREN
jgi:hypothetical protein